MSAHHPLRHAVLPLALAVATAAGLAACKKEEAAPAAPTAAAPAAPAPTPESVVAASVSALGPDQLRQEASKAYSENRLYAPAGNNAMEFYLALRDKQPGDAGASSALTDLLPMTVIAAEQAIAREDFGEAKRLVALIAKADPQHPALSRLRASIDKGEQAAAQRAQQQQLTAEEEAKRKAEQAKQREEEQRRLQEQQRQQAEQQAQQQAAAEAERQRQAAAEAERQRQQAQAQAQPAAPRAAAGGGGTELRPISQGAPRYPQNAQRAGATASVVVEFTVNPDGSVGDVRAVSSDGPRQYARDFEREAVAAAKRWRFQPVSQPVTTRRTIAFQQ